MLDDPEETQTDRPTLDFEAAKQRLAGNERLLKELAQFFVEDVPGLLHRLREAVQQGDDSCAAQAAHSLKDFAATFDAMPTVGLASEVESAARRGELHRAGQLHSDLRRQFQAAVEILRHELLGQTP